MNIVKYTHVTRLYRFLKLVVSYSAARPRYVGVLTATMVMVAWLHVEKFAKPEIAVVVASFLAGFVCVILFSPGGLYGEKRNLRWRYVLLGVTIPSILAGWQIGGSTAMLSVAVGLSLSIPIGYTFGKLGCHRFGCCGWGARNAFVGNYISLPLLESVLSTILTLVVLFFLWGGGDAYGALSIFMIGHGMERVFSKISRQERIGSILFSVACLLIIAGTIFSW